MTIVGPVTVCVAFLPYVSFQVDRGHNCWDNRCMDQWKVLNEYGTNGLQGPNCVTSQVGEVVRSKVRSQEQRVNLGIGQYAGVQPIDSKCQGRSITRLPHTKTKMQCGQ